MHPDFPSGTITFLFTDLEGSTGLWKRFQRRLAIGYNRAATLIERMEQDGIISPANHAGKRDILVGGGADEDYD